LKRLKISLVISLVINFALIFILSVVFVNMNSLGLTSSHSSQTNFSYKERPYYIERTTLFNQIEAPDQAIVFLGDSITFRSEWSEFFPDENVINRGIGGDTTEGVYNRLDSILENNPNKIFLMIGINDILQGKKIDETSKNYKLILEKIKSSSPKTQVYIQSVLPVNNRIKGVRIDNKDIINLNKKIKELATQSGYEFLDIYSLLSESNQLQEKFTVDGIHLTGEAYKEWVDYIKNKVSFQ